jgi:hypothetical protein
MELGVAKHSLAYRTPALSQPGLEAQLTETTPEQTLIQLVSFTSPLNA